jgi:glycosyltransferase involved in cell wall biosynthesis
MAKSILVLTRYSDKAASSRQRHLIFLPALRAAGFLPTVAPLFDDDYIASLYGNGDTKVLRLVWFYARRLRWLAKARRFDLTWIEKEALPWLPAWAERIFLSRLPYVVDFDDVWHLRYAHHPRAWIRHLLGDKFERLITRAAVVVAANDVIAEWARAAGTARVVRLPTVVDTDRYPVRPPPDGPTTIVWIGTPVTQIFLTLVASPLRELQQRLHVRFRAIGVGANFSLPGVDVECVEWRKEAEADMLASCHIGIMPLPDDEWSSGKSAYKLIQYMAAARPAVASAVGANIKVVIDGQTGFLVRTPQEWVEALTRLIIDRELSQKMGLAGRRRVEDFYSLRSAGPTQVQVIARALEPPHKN